MAGTHKQTSITVSLEDTNSENVDDDLNQRTYQVMELQLSSHSKSVLTARHMDNSQERKTKSLY